MKKDKLSIIFRTDSSLEIGTGHVMRCLTLADVLQQRGAECEFICREHRGNQIEFIRERGYNVYQLPIEYVAGCGKNFETSQAPVHASWLGADWKLDAEQSLRVLDGKSVDWLIVDHYALDARWECRLRLICKQLMVIDDLADRKHECDLLLDQNLGRKEIDYMPWVPEGSTVLTGSHYALLRPEFAALREYSLRRRKLPQLKHLLITMGGIDKDNVTSQVLESIKSCGLPDDCCISVVMGASAPWLDQVRILAADMPWPTEVLVNVKDMAGLMAENDFGIGAAGSTSWECCCLGLPSLFIVLAKNQGKIGEELERAGAAVLLDADALLGTIRKSVEWLCSCPDLVALMSSRAFAIVDGSGAQRVAARLAHAKVAA